MKLFEYIQQCKDADEMAELLSESDLVGADLLYDKEATLNVLDADIDY